MTVFRLFAVACAMAALFAAAPARAAQSYDNCTGFIDSLPATITTQGTWCLRKDLNTAMTLGAAITVAANNVTIDCNHFKVGGLAAGTHSKAHGIYADGRQNITVRQCAVRGFFSGIQIHGVGAVVEDNLVDNSLHTGIAFFGTGGLVRGNRVRDTGGTPYEPSSFAIAASADVIDNMVENVYGAALDAYPFGILASMAGAEVRGNRVRGLTPSGSGRVVGLYAAASGITFADNRVASEYPVEGSGIVGASRSFCTGNTLSGLSLPVQNCQDAGGNASN